MKKAFLYILYIIFLYLMLFTPPFLFFRDRLSVGNIIAFAAIVFGLSKPKIIRSFISNFITEYKILIILFVFVILRTVLGGETAILSSHLISIVYLFLVTPMLLYYAKRIGLSSETQVVRAFMIVGTVASLISFICLMTPSLQDYVRNNMLRLTVDDYLYDADYRGFGMALLLTSNYGYVLGLIAAYGSFYLKDNKFFWICIPLLLFAAIINARTGFLLAAIIMGFSIFTRKKFGYGIVIVVLGWLLVTYYSSIFDLIGLDARTVEFSISLFRELNEVASGNNGESTTATALSNMIFFPSTIAEWIIGGGQSGFHGAKGSDIGWIRQINYGGIIYISILYYFFLIMFRRLRLHKKIVFSWVFLISVMIINTKSSIFPGYSFFYMLFVFYSMKILPEYQQSAITRRVNNSIVSK